MEPISFGQISPAGTALKHPENFLKNLAIILPRAAAFRTGSGLGPQRLKLIPLLIFLEPGSSRHWVTSNSLLLEITKNVYRTNLLIIHFIVLTHRSNYND